jgi:hypothetical protein
MRPIRLVVLALLPLCAFPARASDDAEDWKLIGGMLALVQQVVHVAASSPDRDAADKSVEAMLAGENAQANRLVAGLLNEVLQDVPAEQRGAFVAIGRDLLTLARRERERQRGAGAAASGLPAQTDPLQARKELHAMGLNYWDEEQFLAAARRGDRIAVDLFLAGKGLQGDSQAGEAARSPRPAR